ncbi:MAG: ATP-binding protein [Opitutaceae bacterium]
MNELTDIPEEKQPKQSDVADRHFKTRRMLQALRQRTGRLLLTLVVLALVFVSAAVLQHSFVHAQLYRTIRQELGSWAAQIAGEVAYKDRWDLTGYRRAAITAPGWDIVTKDGLIVDVEELISGLFGRVELPDQSIYGGPQTVVTIVGETWRLFGRKVVGGTVMVGICSPENITAADTKLLANASKFGATLDAASSIRSREIDGDVEYAVISSQGELRTAWGGVPLKTNRQSLPVPSDHLARLFSGGKPYLLYFQPILDSRGQEVGTVIVPKDIALEQEALQAQDRFNIWVIGIAALFACATVLWLIVRELVSQTKKVTLEEALKVGETGTIEFKSTFRWDVRQNKRDEERQLDVIKAIAGFLNTKGGTLFIGVAEEGTTLRIHGLAEDLQEMGGSKDKLRLTLRNLITDWIGSAYSHLITDDLKEYGGRCYWEVTVAAAPGPVFVWWKPKGDNESTWHYIKNKWG